MRAGRSAGRGCHCFPRAVLSGTENRRDLQDGATVSGLKRTLGYMAIAQAACLALGLWIQGRLVVAIANWQTEQALRSGTTESPVLMRAEAVLNSIPMSQVVAVVWIVSLQALAAYLLLARVFNEHDRFKIESAGQSLDRARELIRTRDAVIFGLAKLAESRDPETGHHLERIALYSTRLASTLRQHPRFAARITPTFLRLIGISSALHDIGKVGIEDSILLKPGSLTPEERSRMQRHAALGGECIRKIEQRLGESNFLQMAREIAYFHHERWDGKGYPAGIAGEDIPLAARIVAVADVYDALSVRRVYKEAFPHERCVEIIRAEAGKQFDPEIVATFLTIETEFRQIAEQFADLEEGRDESESPVEPPIPAMSAKQEKLLQTVLESERRAPACSPAAT